MRFPTFKPFLGNNSLNYNLTKIYLMQIFFFKFGRRMRLFLFIYRIFNDSLPLLTLLPSHRPCRLLLPSRPVASHGQLTFCRRLLLVAPSDARQHYFRKSVTRCLQSGRGPPRAIQCIAWGAPFPGLALCHSWPQVATFRR